MSAEEILCGSLDNCAVACADGALLKNRNTTAAVSPGNKDTVTEGYKAEARYTTELPDQEDNEEYPVDIMTSSYGEISFERCAENFGSANDETEMASSQNEAGDGTKEKRRPDSLILMKSVSPLYMDPDSKLEGEENCGWTRVHKGQQTSDSQASLDGSQSFSSEELLSSGHRRTGSDASGLSELQGTLIVEGEMMSFVADDLNEKIRLSSPLSRKETPSFPNSRVSTPSLYKQALQPHVPLVDAGALADLEAHAQRVASCIDNMLENLSGTVQSISSLTVDCMETYEKAVCKTCDSVDGNIKAMYQLMAKCEELSNAMKPVYKVEEDIKEIKRLLDLFENIVEHKS